MVSSLAHSSQTVSAAVIAERTSAGSIEKQAMTSMPGPSLAAVSSMKRVWPGAQMTARRRVEADIAYSYPKASRSGANRCTASRHSATSSAP